jgi:large subunit ribosomal protein L10
MLEQYQKWMTDSRAFFMVSFNHMTMKDIDTLRAKVRDAGGEAHVVKNTLMDLALKEVGIPQDEPLTGTTLVGFAFDDAPGLAKVLSDAAKADIFELKDGYLNKQRIQAQQVKALADLPPLEVMRARILGVLMAPASQLARTLAEPGRSIAAVIKAYADKDNQAEAPAAA